MACLKNKLRVFREYGGSNANKKSKGGLGGQEENGNYQNK